MGKVILQWEKELARKSVAMAALWQDPVQRARMLAESTRRSAKAWPEEKVAQLLKLTAEGKSASEIAAVFGYPMTRNGIVGKWHRLQNAGMLLARPGNHHAAVKTAGERMPYLSKKSASAAKPKGCARVVGISLASTPVKLRGRSLNHREHVKPVAVELSEPLPLVNGARISIMQLTSKTCRWPLGDPGAPDFCFCGYPPTLRYGAASPYCEFHARVAHQPLQSRQHRKFG